VSFLHEGYQELEKSLNEVGTWKDKVKKSEFVDVECKIFEVSPMPAHIGSDTEFVRENSFLSADSQKTKDSKRLEFFSWSSLSMPWTHTLRNLSSVVLVGSKKK
jgi:hypothetical protein